MGKRAFAVALAVSALAFVFALVGCGTSPNAQKENVDRMTKGVSEAAAVRDAANERLSMYDSSAASTNPGADAGATAQAPTTYEEVLRDMEARDRADSTRATAPLVKAEDAIELNNSEFTPEQTFAAALAIIKEKLQ